MTIRYYGRTTPATGNDSAAVGAAQTYVQLGPIVTTGPVAISGVYLKYSDAGTPNQLRMAIYELKSPEANSTLVGSVVKVISNPSASSQWITFDNEWAGITLTAGKTYLLATSFQYWGSNADRRLPLYESGTGPGHKTTTTAGAPAWPAPRTPIGAIALSNPSRDPCMYFGIEEASAVLTITNVNTDNTVTHNAIININGVFPTGSYTVNINGYALSIASQTSSLIRCNAFNVFNSTLPFGPGRTLSVVGTTTATKTVEIKPSSTVIYKTIANLFADGLLKDVVGVANGHQVSTTATLAGSNILLYPDTDALFDPAVPNGTVGTRAWYNGSTWDTGPFTMNQGSTQSISWTGTPAPSPSIVGVPYSYKLTSFISGDRPITLTLASGILPSGLALNSTNETIEGIPLEAGTFQSISILADNGSFVESDIFSMTSNSATLSGLAVSAIAQENATISINCNAPNGILTFAVRTGSPYGPDDYNSVKTGPASWRGTISPPSVGVNQLLATALNQATVYYVGVVYSYGAHNGKVSSTTFTTIAYPQTSEKPFQPSAYPNLYNFRDVPLVHDLMYGWGGDNPKTISVNKLPTGLIMSSEGLVTGIPNSYEQVTGIKTVVTNSAGSVESTAFTWTIDKLDEIVIEDTYNRKSLFDFIKVYSDRFDQEVINALPFILKMAESRLNRILKVKDMCDVYSMIIVDGKEYYALPPDFAGLRNIQYKFDKQNPISPKYVNPEQGNSVCEGHFYTILMNQLRVVPPLTGPGIIELAYHKKVPALVEDTDTNWLLELNSDTYVYALLSEVESFVKNYEESDRWSAKLDEVFEELTSRDQSDRWSGHALTVKNEDIV